MSHDMPLPDGLKDLVDNGTTVVTVPTPDGWKCDRCGNDVMHTHGTYPSLTKVSPEVQKALDDAAVFAPDTEAISGSFMRMSFAPPPCADEIMKQFKINVKSTIFTFGDVIHNPEHLIFDEEYVRHEELHAEQQNHNPEDAGKWWARYLQDQYFRVDQEAKAYALQYDWWAAHDVKRGKDRNWRSRKLLQVATSLASPMYGSVVNVDGAMRLIKRFSKTK